MNKFMISFILFISANYTFAKSIPVNKKNLKCDVQRYQNDGGDMYWGHAVYKDKHKQFLKGSSNESEVRAACKVVDDILAESQSRGGFLEIPTSIRKSRSECYDGMSGGQWGGHTNGTHYYIIKEMESLKFPLGIVLSYSKEHTETFVEYCPEDRD